MDDLIARHPKEAQLGGKPGIENKVRAFVDVLFRDDEKKKVLHPEVSVAGFRSPNGVTDRSSPSKGNSSTPKSTSSSEQVTPPKRRNCCPASKTRCPARISGFQACSNLTSPTRPAAFPPRS